MFTDDPAIHAIGAQYFRIIGPTYPLLGVSMVIAFAFQGLGRATLPLAVMVVRVAAVLVAAVVCTRRLGLGERAVFGCIAVGNVLGAVEPHRALRDDRAPLALGNAVDETRPRAMSEMPIVAFADGAAKGNPGPGGWGVVVVTPGGEVIELGGRVPHTTNNRMELTAVIEALRAVRDRRGPSRCIRTPRT